MRFIPEATPAGAGAWEQSRRLGASAARKLATATRDPGHAARRAWRWIRQSSIYAGHLARLAARTDAERLERRLPGLRGFTRLNGPMGQELASAHRLYTGGVSTGEMAISFELTSFLWGLCQARRPRRILNLGSGFSSVVFRRYACEAGDVEVWCVDDSAEWLERTRQFLEAHALPAGRLTTWEAFLSGRRPGFDLVLHDLGDMTVRAAGLAHVLAARSRTGVLVLDDFHNRRYREAVADALRGTGGLALYDARRMTLDRHLRYAAVVLDRVEGVERT